MTATRWMLDWTETRHLSSLLASRHDGHGHVGVYGVPRGGVPVAILVAAMLGVPLYERPEPGVLVVDDIVDSGRTAARFADYEFDALLRKPWSPVGSTARETDAWVVFPWEAADEAEGPADAVVRLIEHVGEDPTRQGLVDTPRRVLAALDELTAGYRQDPAELLAVTFEGIACDEMVVVRDVEFTSLCEHHLLPFVGTADVGYVPGGGRVVGLSKLARLVDVYARRLQVQERLTRQVVDALVEHLDPVGAACRVRARHLCMGCRGVRKPGAEMVTSALAGVMRTDPTARAEFLALAR